jgi:hypothetical protein
MMVYMAYKKPEDRVKTIDPRQAAFKQYYIDPNSPSFANARRSAIRAGYTEQYADNITAQQPAWLGDLLADTQLMRAEMLALSERNLNSVVSEAKPVDIVEKKLWVDTSKYVSGTLGKEVYSTRQEMTGADGRAIFSSDERVDAKMPLSTLFKGVAAE